MYKTSRWYARWAKKELKAARKRAAATQQRRRRLFTRRWVAADCDTD
jgi:hypothetical protein